MDDDMGVRRRSTLRYRQSDAILAVPASALRATLALLQASGAKETCVFWYGPRAADGSGDVAAVIAPKQQMRPGNYLVSAAAMSEMVNLVTESGWKPLAQIHSHPGRNVEHSPYDDRMVSTRRALSLVFPLYGHWQRQWPLGVGVHEHQDDYWHLLSDDAATRRVKVISEGSAVVKDLRR